MITICEECKRMMISQESPIYCYCCGKEKLKQISIEQADKLQLWKNWTSWGLPVRSLYLEEKDKLESAVIFQKAFMPETPGEVKYHPITGKCVENFEGNKLSSEVLEYRKRNS
jgi:hypothetical protein